jgi:hypothetical protein
MHANWRISWILYFNECHMHFLELVLKIYFLCCDALSSFSFGFVVIVLECTLYTQRNHLMREQILSLLDVLVQKYEY